MEDFEYDVFISYKTEEVTFAREVYKSLSENFTVFFSERTLHNEASDDFEENIKEALLSSLVLLNVGMSTECLSGEWLKKEREYFLPLRDLSNKKRKIFNIVSKDFDIKNCLPLDLKRWNTRYFPVAEKEIFELIENAKYQNSNAVADFVLTNKPDRLTEQYEKDVFRKRSFAVMSDYFSGLQDRVGMLYIHGSAGVGKSSFMSKAFNAYEDEVDGKYIYYITGDDDVSEHLERISEVLSKRFDSIARHNDLNIRFKDILEIANTSTKIEKLFYVYSKEIYRKTQLSFTLFVDAVDTLNDERKFISTLVQNYQGIHFVFSGRVVPEDDFLLKINDENEKLDIFKEESSAGLRLDNLEDSLTLEYLAQNLDPDRKLSNKQRKTIQEKIVMKSRGLPKYFEILLSKANTLAQQDDDIFMKMITEIDSAPEELTEYYVQIFKVIEKENSLAMQILEILYWYRDTGIEKKILKGLLNIDSNELDKVLYPIDFLIKIDGNTFVALNHLSISEALFNYYAFTNGSCTARKLDTGYMQDVFKKNPILLYLAKYNSEIYTLLSSVYYFDEDNILLIALTKIINFYINKSLLKNDRPLSLYFAYSKILFAQYMLKKDILKEDMCATDIFTTADTSLKAVTLFNEKVYRQYIGREIGNIFDLRKMVFMTVLDQNTYYQSKYLKTYLEYTYTEKYKKIFALEQLNKISLEGLTSNLSRTYVAMRYKLTGKALDSKLAIYHDESLVMLYDETKSPDKNRKVIDTIKRAQKQKKVKRVFLDKQKRYYNIIKTASNLKLKKYFYNDIYFYAKKNQKLDSYTKDFLNEITVDMLLSDIANLDKNDNFYKYLPIKKKQEINHIFNYYLSYINYGLSSLLKPKNINDFERMVIFIKDKDISTFLAYVDDILDDTDRKYRALFMRIVSETVRHNRNREVLLLCKEYIEEFLDSVGDTPVMILLLILYKLNDLKGLENLEKIVVRQEYQKEERSMIQQLVGTIDNGLDKYWHVLIQRKVSSIENYLKDYFKKGNYDLHEIEFFKSYILEDEKIYRKIIESSYTICDINKLKHLFLFLQKNNLFKEQDKSTFALNIEVLDNVESFIRHIQTFDIYFQIAFLTALMTPAKTNIILTEPLMKYILELVSKHTAINGTSKLLGGFYFHEPFYVFSKKYPELLRTAYNAIPADGTEEEIQVKSMLYRNILAIKGEESYTLLNDREWIPEDQKLKIAASLIFLTKKEESAIALGEFLNNKTVNELDKIKIQIYIGVVFKNNEILDEGIKALVAMRDSLSEWNQSKYHNYLSFTLSHLLSLDVAQLISNLFTTYNFNYYHVNHLLNANTFLSTGKYEVSIVSEPGEFASYYTRFNELQQRLDSHDLIEGWLADDFDNYMMILYDLYKEAEIQGNEEEYNYYKELFSTLKEEKKSLFEESFNKLSSLTLDNYFEIKKEKDIFSLDTLKNDYSVFYTYITKLLEDDHEVEFNKLMEEIKNNEEYFDILKEKSSISSKLQMKAVNISYFEQT